MILPNIFEYLDAGQFLKDVYKNRKAKNSGFSYELWAAELKIKSRAHLRSVVIGEMGISDNLIPLLIDGLNLTDESAEYFTLLAKYSSANSIAVKQAYGRSLILLWKVKLKEICVDDIQSFLSDPIVPVVFTYLSFDDVECGVDQVAQNLGYEKSRVQSALKGLAWQKLIEGQVSAAGDIVYKAAQPFFKVPDSPNNTFLKEFHIQGLKLAEQAHNMSADVRKYYTSFVALNPEQFEEAQKIIRDCNARILALFESPKLNNRRIYRLNSQIFPVS